MRKLVLALVAAMLAGPAMAQTPAPALNDPPPDPWVFVHFADGAMGWNMKAGRWSDNNATAEGERLVYFATPYDVDGKKISWAQESWKISCTANTYQTKSGAELDAALEMLFTLNSGEPSPIQEGTPEFILKRVYCDNVEMKGAQHVTGILMAMDGMMGGMTLQSAQ